MGKSCFAFKNNYCLLLRVKPPNDRVKNGNAVHITFQGITPTVGSNVFIAPTAAVIGDAKIGDDSSIWFGAVVRGDYGPIRIGQNCSIQDNVVIHVNHTPNGDVFPTTIGDDCVIGHGAVVEGCEIGKGCLIGMNTVVLPRATLGEGCVVAAGSVVTEGQNIPAFSLVAGAPAVIKRQFDTANPSIAWAANEYKKLKQQYLLDQHDPKHDR